jgi:transposase
VIRNGLRWRDAPAVYGPHKTLYNRFVRRSRMGIFDRIFANPAAESGPPDRVMIDSTHLKDASDGRQSAQKEDSSRLIGRTKGELNSKLHAVCDGAGRPVIFLLTEGQMSDHKGAALIYPMLPDAERLIADKGHDSDAFRDALAGRGITPYIPPRAKCRSPATCCKTLYRQRHKVENMFERLKDWRRISMRYDRCAHTFFSAICIAATVIFWLGQ